MYLIYLAVKLYSMSLNYEIMPVKNMFDDIKDTGTQFIQQDVHTMASIYQGNSGSYYLIPAVGEMGIKSSKDIIDSIVKSGVIPIEEKVPNPFVDEKARLSKVTANLDYYLDDLSRKLDLELSLDSEIDPSAYPLINKKIKQLSPEQAYQTYFIPLGIVAGEILRRKQGGEWKLDKRYSYNPYFIPYISNSGLNYLPWHQLSDMLLNKKFNMEKYIEIINKGRKFL